MASSHIEAEASDLRVHVELCAMRHAAVEARLGRIEKLLYVALTIVLCALGFGAQQILPAIHAAAAIAQAISSSGSPQAAAAAAALEALSQAAGAQR